VGASSAGAAYESPARKCGVIRMHDESRRGGTTDRSPTSSMGNIYWITGSGPLHLAIMPCPRGGEFLDGEMQVLQAESVDILVSLLAPEEVENFDLIQEPDLCVAHGIEYRSFPITDHSVPVSYMAVLGIASRLEQELRDGRAIVIHCYAGIGRSSLMAACVLIVNGKSAIEAFDQIRQVRGCQVPETEAQFDWVEFFALRRAKGER
jgi:protein-tyrosine phosphatase